MKFGAVVLVVVSVVFVCVESHPIMDTINECFRESNMNMEAGTAILMSGNLGGKLNCPATCILKKFKVINADGTGNKARVNGIMFNLPQKVKVMKPAIEACLDAMKGGGDKCAAGGNFVKCLISKTVTI